MCLFFLSASSFHVFLLLLISSTGQTCCECSHIQGLPSSVHHRYVHQWAQLGLSVAEPKKRRSPQTLRRSEVRREESGRCRVRSLDSRSQAGRYRVKHDQNGSDDLRFNWIRPEIMHKCGHNVVHGHVCTHIHMLARTSAYACMYIFTASSKSTIVLVPSWWSTYLQSCFTGFWLIYIFIISIPVCTAKAHVYFACHTHPSHTRRTILLFLFMDTLVQHLLPFSTRTVLLLTICMQLQ